VPACDPVEGEGVPEHTLVVITAPFSVHVGVGAAVVPPRSSVGLSTVYNSGHGVVSVSGRKLHAVVPGEGVARVPGCTSVAVYVEAVLVRPVADAEVLVHCKVRRAIVLHIEPQLT